MSCGVERSEDGSSSARESPVRSSTRGYRLRCLIFISSATITSIACIMAGETTYPLRFDMSPLDAADAEARGAIDATMAVTAMAKIDLAVFMTYLPQEDLSIAKYFHREGMHSMLSVYRASPVSCETANTVSMTPCSGFEARGRWTWSADADCWSCLPPKRRLMTITPVRHAQDARHLVALGAVVCLWRIWTASIGGKPPVRPWRRHGLGKGVKAAIVRLTRDHPRIFGSAPSRQAKRTFIGLLTLEIRSSIDFALKKPNRSWLSPRKAA